MQNPFASYSPPRFTRRNGVVIFMVKIAIAFVDDHPVMVAGLCQLFSAAEEMAVVATGKNAEDIVDIALNMRPDVMIVDLSMPGPVLEAIAKVTSMRPATRFLAFTASNCIDTAIATLEAGALGYALTGSSLDELREAIIRVHSGETYITPSFASTVVTALRREYGKPKVPRVVFSRREEEVLRLLLRGCTNKEIAEALMISDKTVKHYMTVLFQKLNVRNRVEVVLAAQELASSGMLTERARPEPGGVARH